MPGRFNAAVLDIRRVTMSRVGNQLTVTIRTDGAVPNTDTVGWYVNVASADGSKSGQLGYKLLDGREIAHFVFDSGTAKQTNLEGGASLKGGTLTVTFPWAFLASLGEKWTASVATTAAGQDLDVCPDAGSDTLNPNKIVFGGQ